MKVATFNVRHGLGLDGRIDLGRTLDTIRSAAADVICLQEVDRWACRSAFRRQDAWLASRLDMRSAFGRSDRVGGIGQSGNALFFTVPISSVENRWLPRAKKGPPRCAMSARLTVNGRAVSVITTHLAVGHEDATRQLEAVLAWARTLQPPVVIAGDLNLAPAAVQPAFEASEFQMRPAAPTFPAESPRVQIDHVAVMAGSVLETVVIPSASSDHLCVVAHLEV